MFNVSLSRMPGDLHFERWNTRIKDKNTPILDLPENIFASTKQKWKKVRRKLARKEFFFTFGSHWQFTFCFFVLCKLLKKDQITHGK